MSQRLQDLKTGKITIVRQVPRSRTSVVKLLPSPTTTQKCVASASSSYHRMHSNIASITLEQSLEHSKDNVAKDTASSHIFSMWLKKKKANIQQRKRAAVLAQQERERLEKEQLDRIQKARHDRRIKAKKIRSYLKIRHKIDEDVEARRIRRAWIENYKQNEAKIRAVLKTKRQRAKKYRQRHQKTGEGHIS